MTGKVGPRLRPADYKVEPTFKPGARAVLVLVLFWTVPAAVFAWFMAMNLVPRAFSNHRWYHEHFSDYPKSRRAIIPFLI